MRENFFFCICTYIYYICIAAYNTVDDLTKLIKAHVLERINYIVIISIKNKVSFIIQSLNVIQKFTNV